MMTTIRAKKSEGLFLPPRVPCAKYYEVVHTHPSLYSAEEYSLNNRRLSKAAWVFIGDIRSVTSRQGNRGAAENESAERY